MDNKELDTYRLVWTSFGIMRSLFPFLTKKEVLQMQSCGKFFYEIAVSRVQLKLWLPIEHYFILSDEYRDKFKHHIFTVKSTDTVTVAESITDSRFDFQSCLGSV